ncbi:MULTISPECIES: hypothetical protein [unclassified Cryobacterium]|uniref:hypothetical protein n=1 Tax=unclassified Cryobacterium TaxID=2649013 RepID=UPI002AB5BE05|nr:MULTISPECIES: hypothetical protein [unclassified Cryobacterium]MEB0306940.1 hypothetical protein [Cryobacterium sp. 10I1]MDY7544532.1 hypothetical protein [Cryobacterium sp. 5B3]MDY7555908.1 hypothetical protein [Cryobacterium sp. 10C3]MEB0000877.1 hypothetical protein [Cryobacterium sp. RTS3]MEB0004790.1 hypothetical protein [Cryobacterium sp. RTC2.1]
MTPAEVCAALRIDTLDKLRTTDRLKTFAIDEHLLRDDRQSVLTFSLADGAPSPRHTPGTRQ